MLYPKEDKERRVLLYAVSVLVIVVFVMNLEGILGCVAL